MDPFYFLDLSISDNDENLQLHDIYECDPNGSWTVGQDDQSLIIYKNNNYNYINYDNNTKQFKLIRDNKVIDTLTLQIV